MVLDEQHVVRRPEVDTSERDLRRTRQGAALDQVAIGDAPPAANTSTVVPNPTATWPSAAIDTPARIVPSRYRVPVATRVVGFNTTAPGDGVAYETAAISVPPPGATATSEIAPSHGNGPARGGHQ